MLTHIYFDLDAPINVHSALIFPGTRYPSWSDFARTPSGPEVISPTMIREINELIARHAAVPHWVSSNHEESGPWGESVGLAGSADWPWLDTRDRPGVWGKLHSVRQHIEETKPDRAIWIDDDLKEEHAATLWAAQNRVLTLIPDGHYGITPAMIEQMDWYLE